MCWNNNTRRFSKSREGRQKAMACKLAIFLPDSETPRNVNSRRGGAVLRGIKINLAAFPGNSQTQILTSPITFFSRSSPRHLSLSLSRRHRSTWSISSSEIDLPLLPLAGRSLLVNTRDISSRIFLFPRGGEERVDLARDSLSSPLFARSRAFFYSQVKNKRRILRYFDDNSSVERDPESHAIVKVGRNGRRG